MNQLGLDKSRYTVTKTEGETDPEAQYFVLRIDKDPAARIALQAYADLAISGSFYNIDARLGHDLKQWLLDTSNTPGAKQEYEYRVKKYEVR